MALPFIPSDAGLLLLQAGVVAAPRPAPRIGLAERLRGPAWAAVPLASIVVVIFAIRFVSDTATGLTYLALVAVPPLAAVALAWAARGGGYGARRTAAAIAVTAFLFAIAWAFHRSLTGGAAASLLSGLSCVTLGVLLASVAPSGWLKLGIVAMAAADTWLVVSDILQAPNAVLIAAHPAGGLPQLQGEIFGTVTMGYGDLFVAGLLGALLAHDARLQRRGALLTLMLAALFDLLFLAVSELPATVPVALALIVIELWTRLRRSRGETASSPDAFSPRPREDRDRLAQGSGVGARRASAPTARLSAVRRPSPPGGGIPRPAR